MPTVVVTDYTFPDLQVEEAMLKPLGCSVVGLQCKTAAELIELTREADFVITQFARVDASVIGAMKNAKLIARYGIGVDNVDLAAAKEKGIPVCNVPDYCIDEVADHTLALLLSLSRQIQPASVAMHANKGVDVPLTSYRALKEQTVGVLGFGRIGREVCARLRGFKCAIRVFDPGVPADAIQSQGYIPSTLDELLTHSDIISLHCPSLASTRKIMNASSFAKMKRGSLLVNVARGDLVDSNDLVSALKSGHLLGAGLDVFDPEPIPADHPVRQMPNVILTPHNASATPTASRLLREGVAAHIVRHIKGQPLISIVNGVRPEAMAVR